MTDLTEQEVCIGSLGQQKVYLHWSDVKDICTYAVSAAYEQVRKENTKLKKWCEEFNALDVAKENAQLKELLKECREILDYAKDFAYHDPCCKCITKINQALGEDK